MERSSACRTPRFSYKKFDEIVEFSGLSDFIDTPVKRYSSGMYVRLAFAVAAHLEPKILVVDEVLAVGDAEFQKKCLGRMGQVTREGRTILFVSHNMNTMQTLCKRGIVIDDGKIAFDGEAKAAANYYLHRNAPSADSYKDMANRAGSGAFRIEEISFTDEQGRPRPEPVNGETLDIRFGYKHYTTQRFPAMKISVTFGTTDQINIFNQRNTLRGVSFRDLPESGEIVLRIPRFPLPAGEYELSFTVKSDQRGGGGARQPARRDGLHRAGRRVFRHGELALIGLRFLPRGRGLARGESVMNQPMTTDKHLSTWESWNSGGGPKYPHEKVVQFCFRNYPADVRAQTHALDLGCGGGVRLAVSGHGSDFEFRPVTFRKNGVRNTQAALRARGLEGEVSVCAMQDIDYPPQTFDLVLCIATLGAAGVEAARGALDRLAAICKPGAKAFFLFEANDDFHGGENELDVYGFSRAEVEELFLTRFSEVWIDEHTSTYKNGLLFQKTGS